MFRHYDVTLSRGIYFQMDRQEDRRRNFLMNPYGHASIRYGELCIWNCMDEHREESVRRTRDNRFLITANSDGTLSIFPLFDTSCNYRIAIETDKVTVTHIVVEEHITQVLPNYTVGPEGVVMKMMLPGQDCFRKWPAATFTVTLYDQVDARRFDFRNGKGENDHWVSILTLTTKTPSQRFPTYDRIVRVGYNGHYASDLLQQFADGENRVFGLGFTPPKSNKKKEEEPTKSRSKAQGETQVTLTTPPENEPPANKEEGEVEVEQGPQEQNRPEQSQPPKYSDKPLTIPPNEIMATQSRRQSTHSVGSAASSRASKLIDEKKKKKRGNDAVKIALIENISKTLDQLIKKTLDESDDDDEKKDENITESTLYEDK